LVDKRPPNEVIPTTTTTDKPVRSRAAPPNDSSDLLDLAFDAIFMRTFSDRRITYWNAGAENMYGYTRAEALGHQPAELLQSKYPVPLEQIEAELEERGRWEGEIRHTRKDGLELIVASRWALQTDSGGRPLGILEINSDVTVARKAAAELERSQAMFGLLVSGVLDYAIFALDPDGHVMTWNEGAQRIKGYSADEIIGQHFSTFYPEEEVRAGRPSWELVVAAREGRFEDIGWRIRKDGGRFWAHVVISALRDESGELRGFAKVTRDLTLQKEEEDRKNEERRREAEQLRAHAERMAQLERSKAEFLNLASHELRGPLTVVRGYVSMMEDGSVTSDQVPRVARLLSGKLAQMELLIQQMLETARLEHDRMELQTDLVDLTTIAFEQIDTFKPLAGDREIVMTAPDDAVLVKGDRARLATIVGNLLDNAIKYSPDGGEIECRVDAGGGRGFVSVRDHGVGIAKDDLPLLFTRFGRLPTDLNRSIPGTGLGLFLCREIAHRHGGEILVESWPGEGSRFTLSLPSVGVKRAPARAAG
jgi:PAS domain S-box-containing protein